MHEVLVNKMSGLQGYEQWQQLFDENVSNIWTGESIPALKNLSMIIFSFNREVGRIKQSLCSKVFQLRTQITQGMNTELESKLELNNDSTPKRKNAPSVLVERIAHCANKEQMQSANRISPKELSQNESISIVISDEDKSDVSSNSPEIKKKYRHRNFRRKLNRKQNTVEVTNDSFTPSELQLRNLNDSVQIENDCCMEKKGQNKDDHISMDFFPASNKITECMTPRGWVPDRNNEITDTSQKPADCDFSIVQCTPAPQSKRKDQMSTHLSKKRSHIKHKLNSTLTQMWLEKPKIEEVRKDARSDDFKENSLLNSAMLEDSVNEAEEPLEGLNEFLAKAQNVPDQLEAEPITRGNARKKLPGWSCKECEKFYLKQGLNSDEILALNKCSRHRGYYKPREDTLPGFWDMDVWSQSENI